MTIPTTRELPTTAARRRQNRNASNSGLAPKTLSAKNVPPQLDGCKGIQFAKPRVHLPWKLCEVPELVPEPAVFVKKPPVGLRLPEPAIAVREFEFKGSDGVAKISSITNNVAAAPASEGAAAGRADAARRHHPSSSSTSPPPQQPAPHGSAALVNNVAAAQRFRGRSPPGVAGGPAPALGGTRRGGAAALHGRGRRGEPAAKAGGAAAAPSGQERHATGVLVGTGAAAASSSPRAPAAATLSAGGTAGAAAAPPATAGSAAQQRPAAGSAGSAGSGLAQQNRGQFDRFDARIRFASPTSTHDHQISMPVAQDLSNFNTHKLIAAKRALQCQQLKGFFTGSAAAAEAVTLTSATSQLQSITSQLRVAAALNKQNSNRHATNSSKNRVIPGGTAHNRSASGRERSVGAPPAPTAAAAATKRAFRANLLSPRCLPPLGEPRRLAASTASRGRLLLGHQGPHASSASVLPTAKRGGGALAQIPEGCDTIERGGASSGGLHSALGSRLPAGAGGSDGFSGEDGGKRSGSHDSAAAAPEDELGVGDAAGGAAALAESARQPAGARGESQAKNSILIHLGSTSEAESVCSQGLLKETTAGASCTPRHKRTGSGSAAIRSSSVPLHQGQTALEKDLIAQALELNDLPEELVFVLVEYLSNREKFLFCLAANRQLPHVWGVVVVHFTRQFEVQQIECCDAGVLTQIAAEEKAKAGLAWRRAIESREMLQEDVRAFQRNEERHEVELDAMRENERMVVYPKFATTVKLLQQTMAMWDEQCKQRALIAAMCDGFRRALSRVFALKDVGNLNAITSDEEAVAGAGVSLSDQERGTGGETGGVEDIELTIEELGGDDLGDVAA